MQRMEISKRQTELKKRKTFTLKKSTNKQITRESRKLGISKNAYLIDAFFLYFLEYKKGNLFLLNEGGKNE